MCRHTATLKRVVVSSSHFFRGTDMFADPLGAEALDLRLHHVSAQGTRSAFSKAHPKYQRSMSCAATNGLKKAMGQSQNWRP